MAKKPDARVFGQDIMRGEWPGAPARSKGPAKPHKAAQAAEIESPRVSMPPPISAAGKARIAPPQRTSLPGGVTWGEMQNFDGAGRTITGTSIFDPVLCELAYRWFCPANGKVLDPFAGGSVRGIVAGKTGRRYLGIDLSPKQVAANEEQARAICTGHGDAIPTWRVGDSLEILPRLKAKSFDFVFSCPPYGDLEVYSDDPRDLSTMPHNEFLAVYHTIIRYCLGKLAADRFACFVVGDFRDAGGFYRDFVGATVEAFTLAGAPLYNEMILVTAVGSLPIRVGKQFATTRKIGKTHQNVLLFCKGDPRKATQACGDVEFGDVIGDASEGG